MLVGAADRRWREFSITAQGARRSWPGFVRAPSSPHGSVHKELMTSPSLIEIDEVQRLPADELTSGAVCDIPRPICMTVVSSAYRLSLSLNDGGIKTRGWSGIPAPSAESPFEQLNQVKANLNVALHCAPAPAAA